MAVLYAQLAAMDEIILKREIIVNHYIKRLQPLIGRGSLISMTNIPEGFKSNYHNYIVLRDEQSRDNLINQLKIHGIQSYIHYLLYIVHQWAGY